MRQLQQLSNSVIRSREKRDKLYDDFCRAETEYTKLLNEFKYACLWSDVKHEHKIAALNLSDDVISEVHDCRIPEREHDAILKKYEMVGTDNRPNALYNASLFVFMYGRKWCMDLME